MTVAMQSYSPQGDDVKIKKLVLSGSGAKYPAFIGALHELQRGGDVFGHFAGTSGGAIIAAMLASDHSVAEIERIARTINPSDLLDGGPLRLASTVALGHRGMPKGIYAGDKMLSKLRQHLPKRFSDCVYPLYVVTHDLERGVPVVWSNRRGEGLLYAPHADLPAVVMASMSLPIIFDSRRLRNIDADGIDRDQGFFCDGGVSQNFALNLFGEGESVIGLRFQPTSQRRTINNFVDIASAAIDGMIEAATREHMRDAIYARTITIKSDGAVTDFHLDDHKIDRLIGEGRQAVVTYRMRALGMAQNK